jgi:hypothetical protein
MPALESPVRRGLRVRWYNDDADAEQFSVADLDGEACELFLVRNVLKSKLMATLATQKRADRKLSPLFALVRSMTVPGAESDDHTSVRDQHVEEKSLFCREEKISTMVLLRGSADLRRKEWQGFFLQTESSPSR